MFGREERAGPMHGADECGEADPYERLAFGQVYPGLVDGRDVRIKKGVMM